MSIENTADRDPAFHLLGGLAGMDEYIGGMERQGQQQLVHSDRLPTKVQHGTDEDFLALGFTFGDPDPADPLFRPATLPEGWSREGSDHAMWSYIVDTNGRQRVGVFYKAAFYDRKAEMSICQPRAAFTDLFYGDLKELPVDDWTPAELWIELLTEEHERLLKEAAEMDSYYPEGSAKRREQAEICSAQLVKMQEAAK